MQHPHTSALRRCLATGLLACVGALGQVVAPAPTTEAPPPTLLGADGMAPSGDAVPCPDQKNRIHCNLS